MPLSETSFIVELIQGSDITSLGFNYSSYYNPGMTSPRILKEPVTKWNAGEAEFIEYMNSVYIPTHRREVESEASTLIYQKRANAGVANQIMGTCDVLLLGIVNNRSVQSSHSSRLKPIVNAPAIPSHFFLFPLFNFTFPAVLSSPSGDSHHSSSWLEEARLSSVTSVVNDSTIHLEFTSRAMIPGITDSTPFNSLYKDVVVIESATTFLRPIFRVKSVRHFARTVIMPNANASVARGSWYRTCFHGLFQPSAFTAEFIEPWVHAFEGHFMVGAHIRLAGNLTTWREKAAALTLSQVEAQFDAMESILDEKPNSLLFLATDSPWIEREMEERFGNQLLFVGNLPRTHTGTFTNEAGLMRSYTELVLLSKCDVLFLSTKSSYSRLANSIKKETARVYFF